MRLERTSEPFAGNTKAPARDERGPRKWEGHYLLFWMIVLSVLKPVWRTMAL